MQLQHAVRVRGQGQQREHAALAFAVGPHDKEDVFDRDAEQQGPENQRQNAVDVMLRGSDGVVIVLDVKALLERVERAGADVAKDDAECPDNEGAQRGGDFRSRMSDSCKEGQDQRGEAAHGQQNRQGAKPVTEGCPFSDQGLPRSGDWRLL